MWRLLALVVVLVLVVVSSALQCGQQMECPECKNEPTPESCESGCLTKDHCGCCFICAKAKGDRCGGINDYFGYCAERLYCEDETALYGRCKGKYRVTHNLLVTK